jgi:hypothetical protein
MNKKDRKKLRERYSDIPLLKLKDILNLEIDYKFISENLNKKIIINDEQLSNIVILKKGSEKERNIFNTKNISIRLNPTWLDDVCDKYFSFELKINNNEC